MIVINISVETLALSVFNSFFIGDYMTRKKIRFE